MLDFTKPVQTRDGRKVRILCTDRVSSYPPEFKVIALVQRKTGAEDVQAYTLKGEWDNNGPSQYDLVNVPQRHKHADVIIAWANGAEIECRWSGSNDPWSIKMHSDWKDSCEYRVKL